VAQFDLSRGQFDFSGGHEMKDKSSGDDYGDGNDSAPHALTRDQADKHRCALFVPRPGRRSWRLTHFPVFRNRSGSGIR
jgi:hypothetical protein